MKEGRKLVQREFQAGGSARQGLGGSEPGMWGHKVSVAKVVGWRERGVKVRAAHHRGPCGHWWTLAFSGGKWGPLKKVWK